MKKVIDQRLWRRSTAARFMIRASIESVPPIRRIKNREIDVVLNTPYGKQQRHDDSYIRSSAVNNGVPCITTLAGARALVSALSALHRGSPEVRSIQDHHAKLPQTAAQPEPAPAG